MSDKQAPEGATNPDHSAPDAPPPAQSLPELLKGLQPYIPLLTQVTDALKAHTTHATNTTSVLLVVVVLCLSGLAAYSIAANHIDTAEKIVIALVSFLGGTAMFGGGTKK